MSTREMSRKAADAVVMYRKLVQNAFAQEQLEEAINGMVVGLSPEEMREYFEATTAIERAANEARDYIDQSRLGTSSATQKFRQATNSAGRG